MNRAMRLAIELASTAKTAGFEAVKTAAKGAASGVAEVGRQTKITADATDHMATVSSTATGAIGALGSGLELVGLGGSGAAAALQSTALATDFMSGVTDLATLALESEALASARARVATIAHGVASRATAAAQWALNAAMSANPIMLVVIALAALAAGLVLAYKKSETFRRIVDAAFGAVKSAAKGVGDGFKAVWEGVSKWVGKAWNYIQDLPGKIKSAFSGIWDGLASGLKAAINAVLHLPLKIPKVNTHIPGVGTVGGQTLIPALARGGIVTSPTLALIGEAGPEAVVPLGKGYGNTTIYLTVNGILDGEDGARKVLDVLDRWSRARGGGRVVFAS